MAFGDLLNFVRIPTVRNSDKKMLTTLATGGIPMKKLQGRIFLHCKRQPRFDRKNNLYLTKQPRLVHLAHKTLLFLPVMFHWIASQSCKTSFSYNSTIG